MKWEYKILELATAKMLDVRLDVEAATRQLNELGRDGWELVGYDDLNAHNGRSLSAVMIFKRSLA